MQLRILARAAALSCAVIATAGCQYSPDTAERTVAFNRSIATSTNQLFLLNAIRASKREPTFYSRLASNTTTSTVNPALTGAVPLNDGKSVATTLSNPTTPGLLPLSSIVTTLTGAATTLTPSLGLTETNQLSLANLDDQASTEGVMNSVPLQIYAYMQSEGFNPEELLLMFMGDVKLSESLLAELPDDVILDCSVAKFATENTQCAYYQQEFLVRQHCNEPTEHLSECKMGRDFIARLSTTASETCVKTKTAIPPPCRSSGVNFAKFTHEDCPSTQVVSADACAQMIASLDDVIIPSDCRNRTHGDMRVFSNDPARYRDDTGTIEYFTFMCFRSIERAALELGFQLATSTSHELLYHLSLDSVKNNPRYLADLTQQNLEVAIIQPGAGSRPSAFGQLGVCKKSDSYAVKMKASIRVATTTEDPGHTTATTGSSSGDAAATDCIGALRNGLDKEAADAAEAAKGKDQQDQDKKDKEIEEKKKDSQKIVFSQRSLEAMVYYIGQIIRRRVEMGDTSQAVTFLNGAKYGSVYEEELFDVTTDPPQGDALVEVNAEGKTYFIPSLTSCDGCSVQWPKHASPQILTLLNQIWGLQKAATALPAPTTVTVISSH